MANKKKRWWQLDESWRGYIRDTWLTWIIMIIAYLGILASCGLWELKMITLGQAFMLGVPAFIFFNIAMLGAVHYSREHFGMTDEKIDAFIEELKKECDENNRDRTSNGDGKKDENPDK